MFQTSVDVMRAVNAHNCTKMHIAHFPHVHMYNVHIRSQFVYAFVYYTLIAGLVYFILYSGHKSCLIFACLLIFTFTAEILLLASLLNCLYKSVRYYVLYDRISGLSC